MPEIDCVINEQLRPMHIEHIEDTNFYIVFYEETSCDPLLETLSGVAFLGRGDEKFQFDSSNAIFIQNSGDRRKIISGTLEGRCLCLKWIGRPDMVFVDYLIEKNKNKKEKYEYNWLKEGF